MLRLQQFDVMPSCNAPPTGGLARGYRQRVFLWRGKERRWKPAVLLPIASYKVPHEAPAPPPPPLWMSRGTRTRRLLFRLLAEHPTMAAPNSKRQRLLAPAPNSAAASTSAARGSTNRRGAGAAKSAKSHYKEPGPGSVQLGGGAAVTFSTDLLGSSESVTLFDTLRRELPWEQRCVRVMGRAVQQPRLIAYQADGPGLQYTYSGATLRPAAWHPAVHALKGRVEAAVGADVLPPGGFNSCLLNLYRSGADSIAWHSDNEPLFGRWPTIGEARVGGTIYHNEPEGIYLWLGVVRATENACCSIAPSPFPHPRSLCVAGHAARLPAALQRRPWRQVPVSPGRWRDAGHVWQRTGRLDAQRAKAHDADGRAHQPDVPPHCRAGAAALSATC